MIKNLFNKKYFTLDFWIEWLKKPTNLLLVLILILAAFLRLYNIEGSMIFEGDQGRDAIRVKKVIKDNDIILVGPRTSVGNMFLGPAYYYFMAPFLWLTYPNPVGPAIGVALINIISVYVLYLLAKDMFNEETALLSSYIYAIMAVAVEYSRFSWNPNIMAPLGILMMYVLWQAWKYKKYGYYSIAGLLFGLIIQAHYVALVMAFIIVIWGVSSWWQEKQDRMKISLYGLLGIFLAVLMELPLIFFNFRHDNIIAEGFKEFVGSQSNPSESGGFLVRSFYNSEGRFLQAFGELFQTEGQDMNRLVVYPLLLFSLFVLYKHKFTTASKFLLVTVITLALSTSFYSSSLFVHYIAYIFPLVCFLYGYVFVNAWKKYYLLKPIVVVILAVYSFVNVQKIVAITEQKSRIPTFKQVQEAAYPLVSEPGLQYNIALNAVNRDWLGYNYRYFFEVQENPPVFEDQYLGLDRLIIIDEIGREFNEPESFQNFEIKIAERDTLVEQFQINSGLYVYVTKE